MKVLLVNSVCGIRSTGRICTDIADEMSARGNVCRIAYGREPFVPDRYKKYAVRIGGSMDVMLHAFRSRICDGSGFYSKAATRRFLDWVREFDPDVIHLHNLHGYYIDVDQLFRYLRICGKKIVWTLHDCWPFTGHCTYFELCGCERWKTGCGECPLISEYPCSYIDRSAEHWKRKKHLLMDIPNLTIVTPSQWLKQYVEDSFLGTYPVKVIYNGIDTDKFYPSGESKPDSDKRKVIGVSADWDYRKGLGDFCQLGEKDFEITLVGLSEKQKKSLPSFIRGISRTDSTEELRKLYADADCFVNPSYEDNFPTTNIEALACGTPVVTYCTGGSPEAVGDCGIVVEKGDLDGLKHAIRTVSVSARACVARSRLFTKERMVDSYIGLYEE